MKPPFTCIFKGNEFLPKTAKAEIEMAIKGINESLQILDIEIKKDENLAEVTFISESNLKAALKLDPCQLGFCEKITLKKHKEENQKEKPKKDFLLNHNRFSLLKEEVE